LQFERNYGAFGGETGISYLALRAYAEAEGIGPEDWPDFEYFMSAIDDEWLALRAANRKSKTDDRPAS